MTPWIDLFLVTLVQAFAWMLAAVGFVLIVAFAWSRLTRRGGRR